MKTPLLVVAFTLFALSAEAKPTTIGEFMETCKPGKGPCFSYLEKVIKTLSLNDKSCTKTINEMDLYIALRMALTNNIELRPQILDAPLDVAALSTAKGAMGCDYN